jgi:hypothetical protein
MAKTVIHDLPEVGTELSEEALRLAAGGEIDSCPNTRIGTLSYYCGACHEDWDTDDSH